jgi:asparagine synthetase B (glutamine-hydrolysing)
MNRLPGFTVLFPRARPASGLIVREGAFEQTPGDIVLSHHGLSGIVARGEGPGGRIAVFIGSPVMGNAVNREAAARALSGAEKPQDFIYALKGEYLALLLDPVSGTLRVFADRYGSYPLYYAVSAESVCAANHYLDLARRIKNWPGFSLRPEKAYEFFTLQRLMGTETHDTLSRLLPPAGVLTLTPGQEPAVTRYRHVDYTRQVQGALAERVEDFTARFAAAMKTLSAPRMGIYLSGGHDSRFVAMTAAPGVDCYTLGFTDNYEVTCARRIAAACGHAHHYTPLPDDYFEKTLDAAAYLSGGMYATDHALFLGDVAADAPPVSLHGHGLDFMFQGMYLHAAPQRVMGRETYVRRMTPFPADMPRHFIDTVSFRLKFNAAPFYTDHAGTYAAALYETVRDVYEAGVRLTRDPSALWEYLIFHHPARHYTFTNVLSKRTRGEVRTPSLDHDVYDFYLSLPDSYRLHADVLRGAMRRVNSVAAMIPAGNHALPAAMGPYAKTAWRAGRKILRHVTGSSRFGVPGAADRTWPDRNDYFASHPVYLSAARAALDDPAFRDFLSFIDWRALAARGDAILAVPYGGAFWVSLLTYYRFYKHLHSA